MNRAAAGFYLAIVLGSCGMNGISLADELLMRDNFLWRMKAAISG